MKQAPKNMKEKEAMIKKQFQENVKVQEKQYKAFKNHVLEKTQKREQKAVIKRMKTERKRKMALLWEQYEKTISDLHQVGTLAIRVRNAYFAKFELTNCNTNCNTPSNVLRNNVWVIH